MYGGTSVERDTFSSPPPTLLLLLPFFSPLTERIGSGVHVAASGTKPFQPHSHSREIREIESAPTLLRDVADLSVRVVQAATFVSVDLIPPPSHPTRRIYPAESPALRETFVASRSGGS